MTKSTSKEEGSISSNNNIEEQLKKFLDEPTTKKKSIMAGAAENIRKFTQLKDQVKDELKDTSKKGLSSVEVLSDLENGLKPVDIAKKHNCSVANISYHIKQLEKKDLVTRDKKKLKVKEVVKDLALSKKPIESGYEFQTIQIKLPLKKPEQFDVIDWDKYIPEIKQSFKRFKYLRFTLNRTTKSIRLFLHSRFVEKPEDVVKICKNYVDYVSEELLKYDIEVDKEKAKTSGLHLWGHDKQVKDNYKKDMGMMGIYLGEPAEKILPSDQPKEGKVWLDSTPLPEGAESNDLKWFKDKKTLEEYLRMPRLFVNVLSENTNRQQVYNENLLKHIALVDNIENLVRVMSKQTEKQTKMFEYMKGLFDRMVRQNARNITEKELNDMEKSIGKPSKYNIVKCDRCGNTQSEKYEYCLACKKKLGVKRYWSKEDQ